MAVGRDADRRPPCHGGAGTGRIARVLEGRTGPGAAVSLAPLELAAIAVLAACSVALVLFAAPAQRYAAATAAQLAEPRGYIRAVLGAPPVPGPGAHAPPEGGSR